MFSSTGAVGEYAGGLIRARSCGLRSGVLVATYAKLAFGVPIPFGFAAADVTLVLFGSTEVSLSSEGMMNGEIIPSGNSVPAPVDVTDPEFDCECPCP